MSETKRLNVNGVYFRTPTSLVICPTQNQHLVDCGVYLVVKHLSRFHGYAKSKLLCHKAVLELKSFPQTYVIDRKVYMPFFVG